jgi:hypothetical protein
MARASEPRRKGRSSEPRSRGVSVSHRSGRRLIGVEDLRVTLHTAQDSINGPAGEAKLAQRVLCEGEGVSPPGESGSVRPVLEERSPPCLGAPMKTAGLPLSDFGPSARRRIAAVNSSAAASASARSSGSPSCAVKAAALPSLCPPTVGSLPSGLRRAASGRWRSTTTARPKPSRPRRPAPESSGKGLAGVRPDCRRRLSERGDRRPSSLFRRCSEQHSRSYCRTGIACRILRVRELGGSVVAVFRDSPAAPVHLKVVLLRRSTVSQRTPSPARHPLRGPWPTLTDEHRAALRAGWARRRERLAAERAERKCLCGCGSAVAKRARYVKGHWTQSVGERKPKPPRRPCVCADVDPWARPARDPSSTITSGRRRTSGPGMFSQLPDAYIDEAMTKLCVSRCARCGWPVAGTMRPMRAGLRRSTHGTLRSRRPRGCAPRPAKSGS